MAIFFYTMNYADLVNTLKTLNIKKKGNRPKVNPNKFYPSQLELQTKELLAEELEEYGDRLLKAAKNGGVSAVYGIPGAVPKGFDKLVEKIAYNVSNFQVRTFANFSELMIGERFFPTQESKEEIVGTWRDNFVNLCKSTNEEMRKKVAGTVSDAVLEGRNIREVSQSIENMCSDFTRNKADLIATTEIGKLNTAIARNQSESVGIKYYEWGAAMDGRTRQSHALMDGKICKWGEDRKYYEWEENPKTGKRELKEKERPKGAYIGAPGTDFRCRCVALPYLPEYEDDYEEQRAKGPIVGVTQGKNADERTKKYLAELKNDKIVGKLKRTEKKTLEIANSFSLKRKDDKASFEYLSPFLYSDKRRNERANKIKNEYVKFIKENEMAKIAIKNGYPVVFFVELNSKDKNPDAVVGKYITEFKQIHKSKFEKRFRDALNQSKNVFIKIDDDWSISDFYKTLGKVVKNIKKEQIANSKNKNRSDTIKNNLKGGILFISIKDFFKKIHLDSV